MIRLRVSTLEAFRRVVATDFGDEKELIERIKNGQWTEGPSSWQMQAGTAWHKCLASPEKYVRGDYLQCGQYSFSVGDLGAAGAHIGLAQTFGGDLCEVTARKAFDLDGSLVEVEGTCDHVLGLVIQDHKACFSGIDVHHYEQSLQWRFYLLIHGARCFRYNLFDFKEPKDGFCELKDILSVRFWPYSGMEADCRRWLSQFLDWAKGRRLIQKL